MQNRVKPNGLIFESRSRSTLMGNRGILHDDNKKIIKQWNSHAWITCRLNYKSVKRIIMAPNRYTELFFLDEATSFSSGHRPCSLCRYEYAKKFKILWSKLFYQDKMNRLISFNVIDEHLHKERMDEKGEKKTYVDLMDNLPNGTMVRLDEDKENFYLVYDKKLLLWSEYGFTNFIQLAKESTVNVLTPKSIVQIFNAGYIPIIHKSAFELIS